MSNAYYMFSIREVSLILIKSHLYYNDGLDTTLVYLPYVKRLNF